MNIDFQPLFTLVTRARTIWERHRMMSSLISTDCGTKRDSNTRTSRLKWVSIVLLQEHKSTHT